MTLYVSTACLPNNNNYMHVIEYYVNNGITAIELGSSHTFYPENNPSHLANFVDCQYLIHNYFPPSSQSFVFNLASRDENIRKNSITLAEQAIDLCVILNIPFYSCHAGFITDPHTFGTTSYLFPKPKSKKETQAALDRFITAVQEVNQYAQAFNMQLLVENNVCTEALRGKLLLQTVNQFITFFERLGSSNVGILLDFGHLNVSASTLNFDRLEFIKQLAPYIKAFHIHENDGTADTHKPITNDSWVLDIICHPDFAGLPMVIESHFPDVDELKTHINWLSIKLNDSETS